MASRPLSYLLLLGPVRRYIGGQKLHHYVLICAWDEVVTKNHLKLLKTHSKPTKPVRKKALPQGQIINRRSETGIVCNAFQTLEDPLAALASWKSLTESI